MNKQWAMSCELTCSQSSSWIAQNTIEEKNINKEITLPIPAMALSKVGAMSCEFTCLQSSSMIAQNIVEEKNQLGINHYWYQQWL